MKSPLVEQLSKESGVGIEALRHLASTASKRYKVYQIPKRNGGFRTIEHPSRALKAVQRWLVDQIVNPLPIHDSATAYKAGASIRKNALPHLKSSYTVRHDFKDFFPSFSEDRIGIFFNVQAMENKIPLEGGDLRFFLDCVTRNGRLTIGAPSSPAITNVMMYEFDCRVFLECQERGIIYTRYADDVFFSSKKPNQLGSTEELVLSSRRDIPHLSLRLNRQKTVHTSKKHRREITGLIITPQGDLSVGRQKKREIRALVHKALLGQLPSEEISSLAGYLSFINSVDPPFLSSLRRKYGVSELKRIMNS